MRKKICVALVLLSMTAAFSGCGTSNSSKSSSDSSSSKSESGSDTDTKTPTELGQRTNKLFKETLNWGDQPVYMEFSMPLLVSPNKSENSKVGIYYKDNMKSTDVSMPSLHYSFVEKGGEKTIISHDSKEWATTKVDLYDFDFLADNGEGKALEDVKFETGMQEVDGKPYEYEEMTDPATGILLRYIYEKGTDNLKFWERVGKRMEVLGYGNEVADSHFDNRPSGYSENKNIS